MLLVKALSLCTSPQFGRRVAVRRMSRRTCIAMRIAKDTVTAWHCPQCLVSHCKFPFQLVTNSTRNPPSRVFLLLAQQCEREQSGSGQSGRSGSEANCKAIYTCDICAQYKLHSDQVTLSFDRATLLEILSNGVPFLERRDRSVASKANCHEILTVNF